MVHVGGNNSPSAMTPGVPALKVDHMANDAFLNSLGWSDFFQSSFDQDADSKLSAGRVTGQGRGHYQIQVAGDEILEAAITSKFHDSIQNPTGFPAVGDWVAFLRGQGNHQATIHHVLKRKNSLQRRRAGAQQDVQMIAANVDFMLIVSSCNEDFDLARLGRYIALGRESDCETALLLTKADLCANPEEYTDKFKAQFKGIEVLTISSQDPQSLEQLKKFFAPGKTSVLLGSSGVGKSTLTNFLLGFEAQKTGALSSESKGRHTTTSRNLRFTRWGGMVIDTPGMQEISAVHSDAGLQKDFSDIEELILRCKFTDCGHKSEPGCAILRARKNGELRAERWEEYLAALSGAGRRQKKKKYSR